MADERHPREVIRDACAEHGEDEVVDLCIALLTGRISGEEAFGREAPRVRWIAPDMGGWKYADPVNFYWLRVWAARAFLYV